MSKVREKIIEDAKKSKCAKDNKTGKMSYLEILSELRRSVERDSIPYADREIIMRHIIGLEVVLWKYSA